MAVQIEGLRGPLPPALAAGVGAMLDWGVIWGVGSIGIRGIDGGRGGPSRVIMFCELGIRGIDGGGRGGP